jgi:hypothetical protein
MFSPTAQAQTSGQPCYPPPCGVAPQVTPVPTDASLIGASAAPAAPARSPVPVVVAGLLMLTASLGVITFRRRAAMAALDAVVSAASPARTAQRVREGSFR